MTKLFYIQDSRNYVGNNVLWWRVNGQGYTTNLAEAHKVDENWVGRASDILWPCDQINAGATLQFDMQKLKEIKREAK